MGPTVDALSAELSADIDFYRIEVNQEKPEDWAAVREHFKVGPRIPLLVLFATGRWQRSLQGPAPKEVVLPFITGPLSFDKDGNVL